MSEWGGATTGHLDPAVLRQAEAAAREASAALRIEYVAYLEREQARILRDGEETRERLEAELNEARHEAHLLGALVQQMRMRRAYRLAERMGDVARRINGLRSRG